MVKAIKMTVTMIAMRNATTAKYELKCVFRNFKYLMQNGSCRCHCIHLRWTCLVRILFFSFVFESGCNSIFYYWASFNHEFTWLYSRHCIVYCTMAQTLLEINSLQNTKNYNIFISIFAFRLNWKWCDGIIEKKMHQNHEYT